MIIKIIDPILSKGHEMTLELKRKIKTILFDLFCMKTCLKEAGRRLSAIREENEEKLSLNDYQDLTNIIDFLKELDEKRMPASGNFKCKCKEIAYKYVTRKSRCLDAYRDLVDLYDSIEEIDPDNEEHLDVYSAMMTMSDVCDLFEEEEKRRKGE